jgi:S1-C subfamily serine protease
MELPTAIDRVRPFVVQITYTITGLDRPRLQQLDARGAVWSVPLGTGFVVSEQGWVVTAKHVIDDITHVATDVPEGNHIVGAGFAYPIGEHGRDADIGTFRVIKFDVLDVDARNDIALLKLRANPFQMTETDRRSSTGTTLPLGVAQLRLERPLDGAAIAISGYPLSEAVMVTTAGCVASAWSVDIAGALVPDGKGGYAPTDVVDRYLADAQSNPGNSGGPAYLTSDGAVVGMLRGSRLRPVVGHDTIQTSANLGVLIPSRYVAELAARHSVALNLIA